MRYLALVVGGWWVLGCSGLGGGSPIDLEIPADPEDAEDLADLGSELSGAFVELCVASATDASTAQQACDCLAKEAFAGKKPEEVLAQLDSLDALAAPHRQKCGAITFRAPEAGEEGDRIVDEPDEADAAQE